MKNKPEDQNSELSFLEKIARSRSKEHVESKKQLENAPYHPSEELLRQYVLAELDKSDTEIVMEHLSLCGLCSRKALKITWELNETESLISRIKDFVSSLSFPVSVQFPALEAVRGAVLEGEPRSYVRGTEIILMLEAPADGYVAIFHGCEETGEANLVYPLYAADNPRVSAGQDVAPIQEEIEGPPGRHFFKAFWTKELLLDPSKFNADNDEQCLRAINEFLDDLEGTNEEDWRVVTHEYEVLRG